jgi:thymidine phosphorylase
VDPRVGFSSFGQIGQRVERGSVLAVVHAADGIAAQEAGRRLLQLISITRESVDPQPVMLERMLSVNPK